MKNFLKFFFSFKTLIKIFFFLLLYFTWSNSVSAASILGPGSEALLGGEHWGLFVAQQAGLERLTAYDVQVLCCVCKRGLRLATWAENWARQDSPQPRFHPANRPAVRLG